MLQNVYLYELFLSQYRKWAIIFWKMRPNFRYFTYLEYLHNVYFSSNFDILPLYVIFFELIMTRTSGSVPVDFPPSIIVFDLNLIAVKLVYEDVLLHLLWSYHAVSGVSLYLSYIHMLN